MKKTPKGRSEAGSGGTEGREELRSRTEAPSSVVRRPATPLRAPDVFTLHLGVVPGPEWHDWLSTADIAPNLDGSGLLTTVVQDQAELFGVLLRIRDLGIPLLGVYPVCTIPARRAFTRAGNTRVGQKSDPIPSDKETLS